MENTRDAIPDHAERSRRLGDLIAAHALPVADAALYLDVPLSTLDKLRAAGKGPRCFKIGRRLYVRQATRVVQHSRAPNHSERNFHHG